MSDQNLAVYLHDHLAGAAMATQLLEDLRDSDHGPEMAALLERLLDELAEDRQIVQTLSDQVGGAPRGLKEAAGWVAERASRIKLHLSDGDDIGVFESLELVSTGVLGKRNMWRAFKVLAEHDPRVGAIDLDRLIERANAQHEAIEAHRMRYAVRALRPESSTPPVG